MYLLRAIVKHQQKAATDVFQTSFPNQILRSDFPVPTFGPLRRRDSHDNKDVNKSLYRSEQALRVPAGWGSQISRQAAVRTVFLNFPRNISACVNPRDIERAEGL